MHVCDKGTDGSVKTVFSRYWWAQSENIPHAVGPESFIELNMDPCCHGVCARSKCCCIHCDSPEEATFFHLRAINGPQLSVLGSQAWRPVCSSAAVDHLLQGSSVILCTQRWSLARLGWNQLLL